MGPVHEHSHTVSIGRSAADVFPFLVESDKRKLWVQGLAESTPVNGDPLGVGSRFRDVIVDHGTRTTVSAEIERYQPDDALTARLEAKGFVSRLTYALEETDGRTRVDCSVEIQSTTRVARLLSPLVVKHAHRALENSLAALKRELER